MGLDIGMMDWAASRPPEPVGFDIVRGTIPFATAELRGWAEPAVRRIDAGREESFRVDRLARRGDACPSPAGPRCTPRRNLLFRNNVVRHIRHGNGIWLDIGNANDRITGNVFADIPGDVNPHGIHIEGSEGLNEIDNNIFDHLTGGILIRDTNNVIIAYNLFLDCAEVCVDTVSGINGPRPIFGHTNDVHNLLVYDNVFFRIGRSAIEFNNARNEADGNLYPAPAFGPFGGPPYLRVKFPEPAEWHNLESWRDEYGWDKNGGLAPIMATMDVDKLELTLSVTGDVKRNPVYKGIDTDFFGHPINGDRLPGPFAEFATPTEHAASIQDEL